MNQMDKDTGTDAVNRGVLLYGADLIHYDIVRKSTGSTVTARKVLIKVHPDRRVVATAPEDATDDLIQEAVSKRARWIWQHLQDFAKQTTDVLPRHYVSGETQFYLGRRYVLKVYRNGQADIDESAEQQPQSVKLSRGKLNVTLGHGDGGNASNSEQDSDTSLDAQAEMVKALIDDWYQQKAIAIFNERLAALLPKASWVTGTPSFRVLAMSKQWGSCSAKGALMLNPHLVKAPKECIDYVILHELCHISEHNHSEQFWRLLTQVLPNWKAVKARLDGMAELYLNE